MKTFKQILKESEIKEWKEYILSIPMLKSAIEILKTIEEKGFKAYIVGGAVRDIVMGDKKVHDIDIASNMPMEKLEELYPTHDVGKNKTFGIVVVEKDGFNFEIANFRQDGTYTDGRRPDTVKIVSDFKDDAARRDFSINAMGIDKEGNIIDYFNGKKDIKDKVIRTVGDAHSRFSEDHLRMMRAVRFSSRLGFNIEDETKKAIQKNAENIKNISSERVWQELYKMAEKDGSRFADSILKLKDTGLLKHILPEVSKMDEYEHSVEHHPEGNVFQHTIEALRQQKLENPIINLSVLFHDLGKINTHTLSTQGLHQYLGHAQESIKIIEQICDRLKVDTETKKALIFGAEHHMKIHELLHMSNNKVVQLITNKHWDVLYNVGLVDAKARQHLFNQEEWNSIVKRIEDLTLKYKSNMKYDELKKIVNGELVMKVRNISPSKEVGEIIKKTMDYIINNNIDMNDKEKIEKIIKEV